jgi:hypothetical protein
MSDFARRLLLLVSCVGAGLIAGIAGAALTGQDEWFLAVPAAVALGWIFVGDPSRCHSPACEQRDRKDG